MPGWLDGLKWGWGTRESRRGTAGYVEDIMREPATQAVDWLAAAATSGDADRAIWELRYLRRALGLLIAERDALDDRTASAVARSLTQAMQADRNVAAPMVRLAERQFNERLAAYREMMHLRGSQESTTRRVGRALLLLSGSVRMGGQELAGAESIVSQLSDELGNALSKHYGAGETQ